MHEMTDQAKIIESPKLDPNAYGSIIYGKDGILNHLDKNRLLNKGFWDNWGAIQKKIKLYSDFTPYRKITPN